MPPQDAGTGVRHWTTKDLDDHRPQASFESFTPEDQCALSCSGCETLAQLGIVDDLIGASDQPISIGEQESIDSFTNDLQLAAGADHNRNSACGHGFDRRDPEVFRSFRILIEILTQTCRMPVDR